MGDARMKAKKNVPKESNMAAVYYRFHSNNKCYEHKCCNFTFRNCQY